MNVYLSWAIFLAVLGGISWHYAGRPNLMNKTDFQKHSQETSQQASSASTRKSKAKAKRGGAVDNLDNGTSSAHQLSSTGSNVGKKRKIATPQSSNPSITLSSDIGDVPKEDDPASKKNEDVLNNTDFARKMANVRAGTQLGASSKSGMSKRERSAQKQGSIRGGNVTDSPSLSTGASSTTGADADDDFSPVASPPLPATSTATTLKSGDVSDMLESTAAGPSILRLTDPVNPAPKARAKQPNKAFEPAETKKQRQTRIKREAHRAQVEEAEKERRRLMEKQIRGARMAEGTSAQTRTSAFKLPAQNAWSSGPTQASTTNVETPPGGPPSLLDTFERPLQSTTSVNRELHTAPRSSVTDHNASTDQSRISAGTKEKVVGQEKAGASSASGKDGKPSAEHVSTEEQQIHLVQESEDSWTTVAKRDKKKASKAAVGKENDTSEASGAESPHGNGVVPKKAASPRPAFSSSSNSYQQLGDSGFQDSDWAA
jgi:hypothetical protein